MKRLAATCWVWMAVLGAGADWLLYSTNYNPGPVWGVYTGSDGPFPCWHGFAYPGTNYIDASIPFVITDTGEKQIFIEVQNYDASHRVSLPDYSTNTITLDDRDTYTGRWSAGLRFTNAVPITNVLVRFTKTNIAATTHALLIHAFVTTNTVATVNRDGFLIDWTWPLVLDSSPAIPGNLLSDSSFETLSNHGWGMSKQARTNYFLELYDTSAAYHGRSCLRLPVDNLCTLMSRPLRLAPNKLHVVSAYARSMAGTATAEVGFQNLYFPPSGFGFSNQQWVTATATVTTNWTRISATNYAYKYPESEFRVTLRCTSGTGPLQFDAVQIEEGDLRAYSPIDNLELGVLTDVPGNIFTNLSSVALRVNVVNHGTNAATNMLAWRITDNLYRIVQSGRQAVAIGAGTNAQVVIPQNFGQSGWCRFSAYLEGVTESEDELQFVVLPTPETGLDTLMGHVEWTVPRNVQIVERLGFGWARGLSTTQWGRWAVAEPTQGNFVWYDANLQVYSTNGVRLMQNLGENPPAWAVRSYMTITNPAGSGFVVGETITSAGGSAKVTWVGTSSDIVGNALQFTNTVGALSSNEVITGGTSGTTATISSSISSQTPDVPGWASYVSNWISHYGPSIASTEIWNEPNQDSEIPKKDGTMPFYAMLLDIAVNLIKAISPTTEIVAMGGIDTAAWVSSTFAFLSPATLAKIDRISAHLYDPNGVGAWSITTNLLAYGKPIDNTETGVTDRGSYFGPNSQRKRDGVPVSRWADLRWRVANATESPRLIARNFAQSHSSRFGRYTYYDFRYSGHMPVSAEAASAYSAMDFDDTPITKAVVVSALARILSGYTGEGPIPTTTTNVVALGWSRASGGSAAMLWVTNNAPWRLALTNGYASSVLCDVFGNPIAQALANIEARLVPRIFFSASPFATLSNAIATATATQISDTNAPFAQILVCPAGRVELGREVVVRWMGTDSESMPTQWEPGKLQFSYRLLGLSTNWSTPDAVIWTAYEGLPQGQYTFQLRCVDAAGNVSSVDSRAFAVGEAYVGMPRSSVSSMTVSSIGSP